MKVFVFPGQGSQHRGMGADLFDKFPKRLKIADDVLGYSLRELCLKDPQRVLVKTEFTQPALFTVSALAFLEKRASGARPDYLAGHSLGEYVALFAAGAFDFEVGLQLVKKRGELMSLAPRGGMAAVLGCDAESVSRVLTDSGLSSLDVANLNSRTQTVISGPLADVVAAEALFDAPGISYIPLKVGAAFHSRYMQPVMLEFERFLEQFTFAPLNAPVIANVSAQPYRDNEIMNNLRAQICAPVRWTDTVEYLMGQGEACFEEVGPGQVLTKLIESIACRSPSTGNQPASAETPLGGYAVAAASVDHPVVDSVDTSRNL